MYFAIRSSLRRWALSLQDGKGIYSNNQKVIVAVLTGLVKGKERKTALLEPPFLDDNLQQALFQVSCKRAGEKIKISEISVSEPRIVFI